MTNITRGTELTATITGRIVGGGRGKVRLNLEGRRELSVPAPMGPLHTIATHTITGRVSNTGPGFVELVVQVNGYPEAVVLPLDDTAVTFA